MASGCPAVGWWARQVLGSCRVVATGGQSQGELGFHRLFEVGFAHGLWDLAHLRADSGVARSGAEWCAVVDVLIAVQLVVLPLAP